MVNGFGPRIAKLRPSKPGGRSWLSRRRPRCGAAQIVSAVIRWPAATIRCTTAQVLRSVMTPADSTRGMLLWMSSPDRGGDEVGLDGLVDLAGGGSFEDADDVFVGLAASA